MKWRSGKAKAEDDFMFFKSFLSFEAFTVLNYKKILILHLFRSFRNPFSFPKGEKLFLSGFGFRVPSFFEEFSHFSAFHFLQYRVGVVESRSLASFHFFDQTYQLQDCLLRCFGKSELYLRYFLPAISKAEKKIAILASPKA